MEEAITRDPDFRNQYERGVRDDPQFEAAISGSPQPRLSMPVVSKPLGSPQFNQFVKLR